MKTSLITKLELVKDHRRSEGKRHPFPLILIIIIMATMCNYVKLRSIAAFTKRYKQELIEKFKINKERVPSLSTFHRVLSGLDFDDLSEKFKQWIIENDLIEPGEWLAVDGKCIKSTVTDYQSINQNFISIVSIFSHSKKVVLMSQGYQNKKISEIAVVDAMIKTLGLEDVTFTLDALHTKKNFGNDNRDK